MNSDDLFDFYVNESKTPFTGWNFSYINDRLIDSPLPWNYRSIILPYVLESTCLLDIGTGGGEFLSRLPVPQQTFATESYVPNVSIAKNRLTALGITVKQITSDSDLPFSDKFFDLIIDKHESYDVSEVKRILKPQSHFITQQVGRNDGLEINDVLGSPLPEDDNPDWNLSYIVNELKEYGLTIVDTKECKTPSRVYDIGAIIYYLKAIPWQVPEFSVEKYALELKKLHKIMLDNGYFEYTSERFLVVAST